MTFQIFYEDGLGYTYDFFVVGSTLEECREQAYEELMHREVNPEHWWSEKVE